jgi:hypothetical protein
VAPHDGDLFDRVAELQGQHSHLRVEGESLETLVPEDLPGGLVPKHLQAALGVPVRQAGQRPEDQVERPARTFPIPGLAHRQHRLREAA